MDKWAAVVTDPLGLAGFALFLIFVVLSKANRKKSGTWLAPVFIVAALVSLVGGLWVGYSRQNETLIAQPGSPAPRSPLQGGTAPVIQKTTGDKSPVFMGVTGNVTVTIIDSEKKAPSENEREAK